MSATEGKLPNRLHSVGPGKPKPQDEDQRSIDEEALAGPDGPPPRKLTPEWVAVNLMDITAHLMAAIDKAAGPLDRLANAAEDATAHVVHADGLLRRPLAIALALAILGATIFTTYEVATTRSHPDATRMSAPTASDSSEIRLGGVEYPIDRKLFEARLAAAQPEPIRKYYVEVGGRKFPVKQAVCVGLGAPRASFSSEAAIHALTKLGYRTEQEP